MSHAPRKIIHVDMDAFYAAVEQRDDPALRARPLAVGGSPEGRGVVAAASYEARRFGVRSAMPSARARRLCPEIVFVRPRFNVYRADSRAIHAILADYSDCVESLSLDEAYLDVTASAHGSATQIARDIRARIREGLGLTASAGVSYNKFLAKLASDQDKPDGLHVIRPEAGAGFVEQLPVGRIHGVGPATRQRMEHLGIATGGDLRAWACEDLVAQFGKVGERYYWLARGVDERPVSPERRRKSVGQEHTFDVDLETAPAMLAELERLAGRVAERLERLDCAGRTLTIKVRFNDFALITRSHTVAAGVSTVADMRPLLGPLLERALPPEPAVRLLGVTVSNLEARAERQVGLW